MKINILKNKEGFTIIEVLIVLAIAGLIMLVVLLAVPGLQRTQANSAAKSDATHIAAALTNFTANNNGSIPSTIANLATINSDTSGLSKLTATATTPYVSGLASPPVNNTWYISPDASISTSTLSSQIWVVDIDTEAVCLSGSGGTAVASSYGPQVYTSTANSQAQPTSVALLYTTQTAGGSNWNCLQAQ